MLLKNIHESSNISNQDLNENFTESSDNSRKFLNGRRSISIGELFSPINFNNYDLAHFARILLANLWPINEKRKRTTARELLSNTRRRNDLIFSRRKYNTVYSRPTGLIRWRSEVLKRQDCGWKSERFNRNVHHFLHRVSFLYAQIAKNLVVNSSCALSLTRNVSQTVVNINRVFFAGEWWKFHEIRPHFSAHRTRMTCAIVDNVRLRVQSNTTAFLFWEFLRYASSLIFI